MVHHGASSPLQLLPAEREASLACDITIWAREVAVRANRWLSPFMWRCCRGDGSTIISSPVTETLGRRTRGGWQRERCLRCIYHLHSINYAKYHCRVYFIHNLKEGVNITVIKFVMMVKWEWEKYQPAARQWRKTDSSNCTLVLREMLMPLRTLRKLRHSKWEWVSEWERLLNRGYKVFPWHRLSVRHRHQYCDLRVGDKEEADECSFKKTSTRTTEISFIHKTTVF